MVFAVAQPIGGALVDRAPTRRIVTACLPPLLLALAGLSFVTDLGTFAVVFGAHVFAQSVVFTATMKQAARDHGTASTYGGVFGLLATLTYTMTVLGPLLFLNVYGAAGRLVFAVMAGVGALFVTGWALGPRLGRGPAPPRHG